MTVSEVLQQEKQRIMDGWVKSLYEQIPSVTNIEDTALYDSIPDLLDAMVRALEADQQVDVLFHSQQHGQERATFQHYSLSHVIKEYHILRRILFRVITSREVIQDTDRDTIIFVIDQAIEYAADSYYRRKEQVLVDAREIASKKADQLKLEDEERNRFIESISHDLNNPLNNIKACIELMEDDLDVEEVPSLLHIIRTSVLTASLLVEDFLDVSSVKSDAPLPVKRVKINLSDNLMKEIAILKMVYKRNVRFDDGGAELHATVDIRQIRRAFANLMNNALKHSRKSAAITVSCRSEGEFIKIRVNNEGHIPESVLNSLFDRYYQIDEEGRGWGIGLSFVKTVAEAHEGTVTVSSDDGGVTFTLSIKRE